MNKKVDFTKFDLESFASEFATLDHNKSKSGDAWFKCCFHKENSASLHVTNKQVFHCHGCGVEGGILDFITKVTGCSKSDAMKIVAEKSGQESVIVFEKQEPKPFNAPQQFITYYTYNGGYLLKYRLPDKDFLWAYAHDGKWWTGTGDYDVELYKPKGTQGTVILAEGEKDVDELCRLGYTSVSSPHGSSKWKDEYTNQLLDTEQVLIISDNDYIGKSGSELVQNYLFKAGIRSKIINSTDLNESDKKGYDLYDVVQDIGDDETISRLNAHIESDEMWDVLWNQVEEVQNEKVTPEVEIVIDSGLGEEFDTLLEIAVHETMNDGGMSLQTESTISEIGKKHKLGIRAIRNEIARQVKNRTPNAITSETKSHVMNISELGIDHDISGSGYTVLEETGAIYDANANEVIGHFLSFVGVVIDAESEQDKDVKIALAYNTPQNLDNIKLLVVPKRQLATKSELIKTLSGYNINVTDVNGLPVIQYLQDLQNHFNENTKTMKSLSRFGWYDGMLMPFEQEEAKIIFDSTVAQPIANKLQTPTGDRDKSIEMLQEIGTYSDANATILGAAVGSLVLSFVNEGGNQSFALNVWNETSTGKSVTCQGVASMFGYPYKDGGWWGDGNATMNKDMYHNSLLGNLPNFIDDPARNRGYDSNQKRDYIFSVTSGQGRGRMGRGGDLPQDVREWCNIMIMTNETPFIDESIQDGGARARCLEVCFDKPLDAETVNKWIGIMGKNYGHFATELADTIRSIGRVKLDERIKDYNRWFNTRGVDGKRGMNAAMILVGLDVVNDALGLTTLDPKEWLVKQIRGSGALSDGERAYIKLIKRVEVSENIYRGVHDARDQSYIGSFGYSKGYKVLNLAPKTIEKYASEDGFNEGSLVSWCYANGKMIDYRDENNSATTTQVTNGTTTINVVQLKYDWKHNATHSEDRKPRYENVENDRLEDEF